MQLFYEFLPIVLFFVSFKFYGIYVATAVLIAITGVQFIFSSFWNRKIDKKQLIIFIVCIFFGGMTLYFHNPLFVKWKPTVVFWIFGGTFLISHFFKKTIIQRMLEVMMENKTEIPVAVWKRLNMAWSLFFILLGSVNLYVAYQFSTDAWVNFKLYGVLAALFIFSFLQAIYLARYMIHKP